MERRNIGKKCLHVNTKPGILFYSVCCLNEHLLDARVANFKDAGKTWMFCWKIKPSMISK